MDVPRWLRAQHFLALGGALIAYGGIRSLFSRSGLGFSGPAEDYSPLQTENLCDPTPKPGVTAFMNWVLAKYGGTTLGIIRECGGSLSGHTAGMAWDWGTLQGNAQVDALFRDLFANGDELIRRAGITYFIYNGRIWNTRSKTWQNYTGPNPHTDHVHFSFSTAGAYGRTSFYQALLS